MSDTVPTPPHGKILLVDDDKFLLEMYTMKFTQQGFEPQGYLSAKEALDVLVKGFVPQAILFDLIMPELDGFAFLEQLRSQKLAPNALKVALTNQNSESDQMHVKDLGADLCLVKASMIPSEVVNTVSAALAKRTS
ncbi:MAG TPA: response regulator [Candidatus Paceibacterota bacterium]|nr:response regulator [Candidatus Paceibacterota bacterium]